MSAYKEEEHKKAIELRKQGMSYSQIKEHVDVSKSTLSRWLQDYPLSDERIKELRDNNPKRIERFRNTMRKKREAEFEKFYQKAKEDIGDLNKRELLLSGFFLYWAEGGKTQRYTISVSNTDPAVLKFFVKWLELLEVPTEKRRVKLHLYKDMDADKEIQFWSNKLKIPKTEFENPYIKDSSLSDITYKNGYSHGTCNIFVDKKEIAYYVHQGLKYLQEKYD